MKFFNDAFELFEEKFAILELTNNINTDYITSTKEEKNNFFTEIKTNTKTRNIK